MASISSALSPPGGPPGTSSAASSSGTGAAVPTEPLPTAVPTLKVMRLQSPELGQPAAGTLGPACLIGPSCTLPDTFGVIHIGETFTAYLGALNADPDVPVRRLTVSAQLQTPSRRWPLPCGLEGNATEEDVEDGANVNGGGGGVDVPPGSGVDAIVSRPLEEVGQHILRVEVGYGSSGAPRTLRKFYRFNVSSPLHIRELTVRTGDAGCFVSIAVENAASPNGGGSGSAGLTVCSADFHPPPGLVAERISGGGTKFGADGTLLDDAAASANNDDAAGGGPTRRNRRSAVTLFDQSGRLEPGESYRYLFHVRAASEDATLRGIAYGDELGKAVFAWRKAMGEAGRIASASVRCPPSHPPGLLGDGGALAAQANNSSPSGGGSSSSSAVSKFVVHGSGLSVDAAAAAANRMANRTESASSSSGLDRLLPVTVEPIDPPNRMVLARPIDLQLLVVNHSSERMNLQLQMRLGQMSGVVVCGPSFKNLGEVSPSGGSAVVGIRLMALVGGLFRVQGCCVVDLTSGREVPQPALFSVFVERGIEEQ